MIYNDMRAKSSDKKFWNLFRCVFMIFATKPAVIPYSLGEHEKC